MEFIRVTTENIDSHLEALKRLNDIFTTTIDGKAHGQLFPEWEDTDREVYVATDGTAMFTLIPRVGEVRISRVCAPGKGNVVLIKIRELYPGIKLTTSPANKRSHRFFQNQGFVPNNYLGLWVREP